MVTDLRIPEGIVVRTAKGGPDSLKAILADLKQYSFSGYVRVTLEKDIMSSMGYIVVEQGTPVMAIYEFEKSKPRELRRIYTGEKSLRFILEDSQDKGSSIELHSRVSSEEFERRFPDSWIAGPRTVAAKGPVARVPAPAAAPATQAPEPPPPPEAEDEERPTDPGSERIEQWRRKGFKVDTLLEAQKKGAPALTKELAIFDKDVDRLKQFEAILNNFPILGHEPEINEIRAKLDDRSRIAEIESDIEFLQEKIRRKVQKRKAEEESIKAEMEKKKREEKAADVYDLILKYQTGTAAEAEGAPAQAGCPRCGGKLDPKGSCPKCSAEEIPAMTFTKPLQPDMTFQSFVVGPNSKFPVAAAVAVSEGPGKTYNPLLIFGGSGLGKTHLLVSIGNKLRQTSPSLKILYVPSDRLVEAFDQAKGSDLTRRIREDLKKADVLLVDDLQFLAASEAAQNEMVNVIDSLIDSGKQVAFASDRVPAQIPAFSERLSSRIQKGLTADIQPPDLDTRVRILKAKAAEKKLRMSDEIVAYIAERVTNSVRELESTLNKISAFATIMKLEVDLALVSDILKPLAPVQETRKEIMKEVKVQPGHCYLIEEEKPTYSNVLLSRKMKEEFRGLVITRMNPKRVREEFQEQPEILWLTDRDSSQETTVPPSLEMMVHKIQEFIADPKQGMVVLDGIQYLISSTNFEAVLRFIRSLIDEVSESKCILAISVSPETLKQQEISILEREMEVLNLT
ncbi:MAG: DnaA/Hda family protein [Thermoplasmata archaeon]|jgi:chromosomal replication initiator protein DnaA|nr:DnaA/Hda family protein [Thermoplasmata archaeon]